MSKTNLYSTSLIAQSPSIAQCWPTMQRTNSIDRKFRSTLLCHLLLEGVEAINNVLSWRDSLLSASAPIMHRLNQRPHLTFRCDVHNMNFGTMHPAHTNPPCSMLRNLRWSMTFTSALHYLAASRQSPIPAQSRITLDYWFSGFLLEKWPLAGASDDRSNNHPASIASGLLCVTVGINCGLLCSDSGTWLCWCTRRPRRNHNNKHKQKLRQLLLMYQPTDRQIDRHVFLLGVCPKVS